MMLFLQLLVKLEKERNIIINEFALYNAVNKLHFNDFMPQMR